MPGLPSAAGGCRVDGMMKREDAPRAAPEQQSRCPFCGKPEQLVWVHGHGQCAHCGVNAMPCCDGAVSGEDAEKGNAGD